MNVKMLMSNKVTDCLCSVNWRTPCQGAQSHSAIPFYPVNSTMLHDPLYSVLIQDICLSNAYRKAE